MIETLVRECLPHLGDAEVSKILLMRCGTDDPVPTELLTMDGLSGAFTESEQKDLHDVVDKEVAP